MIRWIGAGSPIRIDGDNVDPWRVKGDFYASDMRAMMRVLHGLGMEFTIAGSPTKGIRGIVGHGFTIYDAGKAWLLDRGMSEDEMGEAISGFEDLLGDKFGITAAKSMMKLMGRVPWIDRPIERWARAAFSGGIQWSNPGVYPVSTTSDMREAYYWAMHKQMLPKKWVFSDTQKRVSPMSLVYARIKARQSEIPLLPQSSGMFSPGIAGKGWIEGVWWGLDVITAEPWIEDMEIIQIAYAGPTAIMQKRVDLDVYPKPLRKRLALVGYGVHAQAEKVSVGVFEENLYGAAKRLKTGRLKGTGWSDEDNMMVWWQTSDHKRPYARIDWAGMVTARVRHRLLGEAKSIMQRGGRVARLYVDSITADMPVACGYGEKPGEFKIESNGAAIIGPPGIGWIAGKVKHSGVPIEHATRIICEVRDGTYRCGQEDWTGPTEEI